MNTSEAQKPQSPIRLHKYTTLLPKSDIQIPLFLSNPFLISQTSSSHFLISDPSFAFLSNQQPYYKTQLYTKLSLAMEATTSGTKSLVIDNNPPIVPTESQQQQVEALICTQQWLRSPSKEYNFHDSLEEVQNIEQVDEEYGDSPLSID
ncbi:uncharacterized protein LOC132060450 [Lycium ferocissimum]|uniref:uncharacterized protein LOC132060450 n=1 Tax=Lycium ferocissimum TaxID=112874 RepID=UPI0028158809|nr:uncharacterized protein LOC132060450 [Lycium ferocissimum]